MTEQERNEEQQATLLNSLHEEVAEEAEPALQFVLQHAKAIGAALVAVVAIVAGYGVYDYNANTALQTAYSELGDIVVNHDAANRVQSLESFLAKAPNNVKQAVRFELVNALLAQKKYEEAASVWDSLAAAHGSDIAVIATMGKAHSLALAGKVTEAVSVYETLLTSVHESYKGIVQLALAPLAEKAGNVERALALYEELAKKQNGKQGYFTYKAEALRARLKG